MPIVPVTKFAEPYVRVDCKGHEEYQSRVKEYQTRLRDMGVICRNVKNEGPRRRESETMMTDQIEQGMQRTQRSRSNTHSAS